MNQGRRRVLGAAMGGVIGAELGHTGMARAEAARVGATLAGAAGNSFGGALTMATGEPGGGFAEYGPEWGQRVGRAAHVTLSYRVSGGSAANILLVEQGAAQLGLTTMAVAAQAWQGDATWTGRVKLRGFRALFPIYQASWQVIAPRGGRIRRLEDLAGAVVGVGPAGGASAVLTAPLLGAVGIAPRLTIAGLYAEQIELMRQGRIGACAFLGITPLPALVAAAHRGGFNLLGIDRRQQDAMRRRVVGTAATVIPQASLPGQGIGVATIGSGAIAIGRADLPDALVARLTAAALDHRIVLRGALPDTDWISDDDPVAIHPGAVAGLRRHGFAAPARLIGRELVRS